MEGIGEDKINQLLWELSSQRGWEQGESLLQEAQSGRHRPDPQGSVHWECQKPGEELVDLQPALCSASGREQGTGTHEGGSFCLVKDMKTSLLGQTWFLAGRFSAANLPLGASPPGGDPPWPQLPPCWKPALEQLLQGHFSTGWLAGDRVNCPTPRVTSLPPLQSP